MNQLTFLIIVAGILLGGMAIQLQSHEEAHVQIFKYAGVDSHIEYGFFSGLTVPDENYATRELAIQGEIGHGINEAVAYNLTPLALMICGIMIACTFYLKGSEKA